jgi:hypothetical protein
VLTGLLNCRNHFTTPDVNLPIPFQQSRPSLLQAKTYYSENRKSAEDILSNWQKREKLSFARFGLTEEQWMNWGKKGDCCRELRD